MGKQHDRFATLNKTQNTNPDPQDRFAQLNSFSIEAPKSTRALDLQDNIIGIDKTDLDENLPFGTDIHESRAAAQSTLSKWGSGLMKGVSTFATASGQTVGIVGGGIVATSMAALGNDFDSDIVFKNPVVEFFAHVNDKIVERNPNYYSQAEENASVLSNMATANFWSDKFINGVGFMASALVTGAGAAGLGVKLGLGATKLGAGINTFQAAVIGRMGESGIEANDTYEQTIQTLKAARQAGENNYSDEEIEEFAKDARGTAFGFNMMLAIPDAYQLGKIFKTVQGKAVGKSIFGKGRIANAAEQLIIESQEENYQLAVSNMAVNMANNINSRETEEGAGEYFNNIVGGMLDNFRTKEGQEAMVLGGLLGGGMGLAFKTNDRTDIIRNNQSDSLIKRNNILVNALNNDLEVEAIKKAAIEKNDLLTATLAEDMQMTNLIYSKLVTGKIDDFIEEVEATAQQTPEQFKEAYEQDITAEEIQSQKAKILTRAKGMKAKFDLYPAEMHEAVKGNLIFLDSAQNTLVKQIMQLSPLMRAVEAEIELRDITESQLDNPLTLANGDEVIPSALRKELDIAKANLKILTRQTKVLNDPGKKGEVARDEIIQRSENSIPEKKVVEYKEPSTEKLDEQESILDDIVTPEDLNKRVQIQGEPGKIYKVLKEVAVEDGSINYTLEDIDNFQKVVNSKESSVIPVSQQQEQTGQKTNLPPFDLHEIIAKFAENEPDLNNILINDPNWKDKIRIKIGKVADERGVEQRLEDFNSGEIGRIEDSNIFESNNGMLLIPSTGINLDLSYQDDTGDWITIGHVLDPSKYTDQQGVPLDFSQMTEDDFFEKFRFRNAKTGEGEIDPVKFKQQAEKQQEVLAFKEAITDWVAKNNIQDGTLLPQEFMDFFLTKKGYDHTEKGEWTSLNQHTMLKDPKGNYIIVDTKSMKSIVDGSSYKSQISKEDLLSLEGNNRYLVKAHHPTLGPIWIKGAPKTLITKAQQDALLNTPDLGINEIRLNPTKEQVENLNANLFISYQSGWNFKFEASKNTKTRPSTLKLNVRKGNKRYNIFLDRSLTSLPDLTSIVKEGTKGEITLDKTSYKKSVPKGIINNKAAEKLFTVNTTPDIVKGARINFVFKTDEVLKTLVKPKRKSQVKPDLATTKPKKITKPDSLKDQAAKSQSTNEAPSNENPDDVFKKSELKASTVMNYSEAKAWLADKLPKEISVKELETTIDNLDKNKYIWGKFSRDTIFLSKEAGEGTQYHEAFHAVFRTLLSDEEIKRLYKISSSKFGAGKTAIAYEELMADAFMAWKADQSIKTPSPLKALFKKIMAFARWITGQEGELERLFKRIDNGSFRYKTPNTSNAIKFHAPAYKMLVGNDFYKMSAIRSEEVIFTTAATVIDELSQTSYTHKKDEQDFIINRLVDEYMDSQAVVYDYTSESNKQFEGDTKVQTELAGLESVYNSDKNRTLVKEEVKKLLSMYQISYQETELEDSDETEYTERQFDLHQGEAGGFSSLSKEVKQFIGLTTYNATDHFNNNITKALNSTNVYYALLRRVSSNSRPNILAEFKEFAETDTQIEALYNKFLAKTGFNGEDISSVQDLGLFNRFLNAFEQVDADYIQSLTTKDELMSMSANRESSDVIHFNNWERNASESNIFENKKTRHAASLDVQDAYDAYDLVDPTDAEVNASVQSVIDAMNVIGVDLSVGYVRRSLLEHHGLRDISDKETLTREHIELFANLLTNQDETLFAQHIDPETGETVDSSGARSTLIKIAGGDILYRTDVYETSYQDAENKTRYSFVLPSYIFTRARELKDQSSTELEDLQNDPYFKYNPLLQLSNAKEVFANIKLAFTGDYTDATRKGVANTFKSTDPRSLLLSWYGLYNRKGDEKYAYYTPMVYEAKSTAVSVKLPKNLRKWTDKKGNLTRESNDFLFNTLFLQEHQRIAGETGIDFRPKTSNPWVTLPMMNGVTFKNKLFTEYSLEDFNTVKGLKGAAVKALEEGIEADILRHMEELTKFRIITETTNDLHVKQENLDNYIRNYYMDDFVNSVSISQLLTGDLAKFKNPTDNVKRMGGIIAYGTHFGSGTYNVVYKGSDLRTNKGFPGGENNVDADDAQVWVSVKRRMFQMDRLGRLNDKTRAAYEKIDRGEKLSIQENKLVDGISLKTVHFDGTVYHKMSEAMLTREAVSQKVKGDWIAKPGKEEGHNMLEFMKREQVDSIVTESASKILKASVAPGAPQVRTLDSQTFKEGIPTSRDYEAGALENEFLRLQVEMHSGKEEIVSGTQMAQLIDLMFNSDPATQQEYYKLLAKNRSVDFAFASTMIKDKKDVGHIAKKLVETLESSGGDAQTVELLETEPVYEIENGEKIDTGKVQFKHNLNLPHIAEKIEQIFLSHMTKGTLQQKVPGYKLTLMSAVGFNKADGESLQIHKISDDAKSVEVAEVMMTRGALKKLIKGTEYESIEDIDPELLTMVGTRIPTQAHHSMIPFKIVEFLPEHYGDVIIAPAEITTLSGADYDIDSMFVYRKDFFLNKEGKSVLYGSATTNEEKYAEYVAYHMNNNKTIKKAIKDTRVEFANIGEMAIDDLSQDEEIREIVFEEYGLFPTFETFMSTANKDRSNNGARNNRLVDIYLQILTDPTVPDLFEPVSMDLITHASNRIYSDIKHLDNAKDTPLHHSVAGKLKAHTAVSTGKKNIGPIAASNNINAFLTKSGVVLSDPIEFLGKEYDDYSVIQEDDIEFMQSDENEWTSGTPEEAGSTREDFSKINSMSTLVSAMTDDTKHGFAHKLNLEQFNLSIYANMISLGMGFNRTMAFASQPILIKLSEAISTSEASQTQTTAEFIDAHGTSGIQLGEDNLIKNFTRRNKEVDGAILKKYLELEKAGASFQSIGKLLKLNKGDVGINMVDAKKLQKEVWTVRSSKAFLNLDGAIEGNANINTNMHLLNSMVAQLNQWFIGGSTSYNKLEDSVRSNVKEFLPKESAVEIDRALRSYLTLQGLTHVAQKVLPEFNLAKFNYTANPNIKGETLAKKIQKLSNDPKTRDAFRDNEGIKALSVLPVFNKSGYKNEGNKTGLDQVTSNTRIKRSPLTMDRVTNGFLSLGLDYEGLTKEMLRYAMVKDNLRFKNGSFLKFLDLSLFKGVSAGLDVMTSEEGQDLVDVDNFLKLFLSYRPNGDMLVNTEGLKGLVTFRDGGLHMKSTEELEAEAAKIKDINSQSDVDDYVFDKKEAANALPKIIVSRNKDIYFKENPLDESWVKLTKHGNIHQLPYHMTYEEAVENDKYEALASANAPVKTEQEVPVPTEEPPTTFNPFESQEGKPKTPPSNPFESNEGKLSKNSTMGDVVNYNFTKAIQKLSKRFGFNVELVHQKDVNWKGRYQGGTVFLNTAHLTGDTLFHEFAHPFIEAVKAKNPALYSSLEEQIRKEEIILEKVQILYPELDTDGQIDEAITQAIGLYAAEEASLPKTLVQKIKALLKEIMNTIREFFSGKDMILPSELNAKATLQDIGAIMAKGDQVFDLGELSKDQARYQKNQAVKLAVQPEHVDSIKKGEKVISLRDIDNDIEYKEGDELEIYAHGKEQGIKVVVKTARVLKDLKDVNKDDFAVALGYEDFADFTSKDKYAAIDSAESLRFPSVYQFLQGNRAQQIIYYELASTHKVGKETPLSETIKKVQEALLKQIQDFSKKITNKNLRADVVKAFVKKRERLLKAVTAIDDAAGLEKFVVEAHDDIIKSKARLDSVLHNIDDIKSIPENQRKFVMNTINEVKELISAYHMIASISSDEMKEMLGESEVVDKMIEAQTELKNLTSKIDNNAIPLVASWLMSFNTLSNADIEAELDVQIERIEKSNATEVNKKKRIAKIQLDKNNMLLTQETMEDLLRQATRDISFGSLGFEAAISSSDRVTGLFAKALKYQEFRANVQDTIVREKLDTALKAYQKEQKSKGVNADKFYQDLYVERKDKKGVDQIYLKDVASTPAGNDLLQALKEVYNDSQDKLPESVKMGNIIPFTRKSATDMAQTSSLLGTLKSEWKEITQPVATDTEYGYQTADGKAIRQVPIFYVYRGQDDKAMKNSEISKDLVGSILKFAQMSNKYQQYRDIQSEVDLFEQIVKDRTVAETSVTGAPIVDKVAKKFGLEKYITSDTARVNTRVQEFINMTYYGEQEKPILFDIAGTQVDTNKLLNFLGKWTGFTTLAFNFLSAMNNVVLGNFYIFQEGLARQHFGDMKFELAKGKKIYYAGLPNILKEFGEIAHKSKEGQVIDLYDAMQGSFRDETGNFITGNKMKKAFSSNALFFANQAGEHEMQVSTLFAAMAGQKVKVKDGGEISLWDAYSLDENKNLVLRDDVEWSEKERFNFMNKIHAINKSLHGNYNDFDKTVIQKNALGRLALMFRKFMAPGIRRRYGKKIVDVESGEIHEGFMRQFIRQLSQETKELANWALLKENSLTDYERSNLRRMTAEVGMYVTTMGMFAIASTLLGDDDDDWIAGLTLYEIRRFQSELGFYMSITEPIKILKSPTATTTTLERIAKFGDQLGHTLILDGEYTHYQTGGQGYKKGDSKLWAATKKLIPVLQGIERTQNPGQALKYFDKLF